jgi:hypothetical protein
MTKRCTKIFSVMSLLVVLVGCGGGGSGSEGSPGSTASKVSVSPPTGTVRPGATFTRTIEVQKVDETFYAAMDLTYDPAVIEYTGATEGSFLNQDGSDATSFEVAFEDGEPGKLTIGLTRFGATEADPGSGTLLALSFKALSPGTTSIAFDDPKGLMNSANQDVGIVNWEDGSVTVE